ncbi:PTS mannose transporter subunit IID [Tyzzerella sp. An114]|uniref:PTS sugar transporter subunit IIA n=1 Tax=Tyzzerella sp. An114 TaxID=1965545 RepID=UPI000B450F6D|nr:PTS sugar transporter subunit IIA [Tyzzerella sp. An114]OUQ55602.1 PTS mannose transporter subunit IID [Tyzzerella sp. An114]
MEIILAAHGNLSVEMKNTAEMIFGKLKECSIITFIPGENTETLKTKFNELINNFNKDEKILIIVDLFGGSPYNAAFEVAMKNNNIEILTGLSVPMLLDILVQRESGTYAFENLFDSLNKEEYIRSFRKMLKEIENDDEEEL